MGGDRGRDARVRSSVEEGMVLVPGGAFTLGDSLGGPGPHARFAPRRVELPPYWIDRYPYPNVVGERPLSDVSWYEAATRCRALGKRLCTEAEWERACKGPEEHRYSYGDEYEEGRCHTGVMEEAGHAMPLAQIGEKVACVSGFGVYGMLGNVNEWVADIRGESSNEGLPFPSGSHLGYPILRGGDFGMSGRDLTCSFRNHSHTPFYTGGDDGFRCCRSAAPAGIDTK
jgi:formylglycine-generating enzyme required for sulfatase activity